MSALDQWFSGGAAAGSLPVWIAGAIAALLFCVGVLAFARASQIGRASAVWRVALLLVGAGLMWLLAESVGGRDNSALRRALDVRSAELTLRSIAPGSPLACLEALANANVEEGCERALFANAETVASAAAYVDARLALLADGSDLAVRDPGYAASIERSRRALEADRFGFVAHVLATRGCTAEDCPALKLFRDSRRVAANLRDRTFDASVILHAPSWRSEPSAPAVATTAPPSVPTLAAVPPVAAPSTTGAAPMPAGKFDFPSSASIPAISIMNAEPPLPPGDPGPDAPAQAASKPAARRAPPREAPQAAQVPQAAQQVAPSVPLPLSPPGTLANPR